MKLLKHLWVISLFSMGLTLSANDNIPEYEASILANFKSKDARQGVAVDSKHFYATNNFNISKHDKTSGRLMSQWLGGKEGDVLIHLDSLMAHKGKLYASHSNYGSRPMTSSVEIWDADSLEHIGTHSFGINRGSFTWLDRHNGFWWGAFANYDKHSADDGVPYGQTLNTQIVKMDDTFNILQSWILPDHILDRIRPMSNSGGSWGADGYLYITGHDHGELYVMEIPKAGSVLHHAATIKVDGIEGQGIAWDRSTNDRILWGIRKKDRHVYKVKIPDVKHAKPQKLGAVLTLPVSE